jgi:hypothetical protein
MTEEEDDYYQPKIGDNNFTTTQLSIMIILKIKRELSSEFAYVNIHFSIPHRLPL